MKYSEFEDAISPERKTSNDIVSIQFEAFTGNVCNNQLFRSVFEKQD